MAIMTHTGGADAIFDVVAAVCIGLASTPIVLFLMAWHVLFTVIPRRIRGFIVSIWHKATTEVSE